MTLAIMSTVVLGLGSAIMLSARAAPSTNDALGLASQASKVIEEMTDDLTGAVLFESANATDARFKVADRDADSIAEVIEYAWSGVAGEPLTRKLNTGSATPIIDQVDALAMTYQTRPPSLDSDAYSRLDEEVFWGNTATFSLPMGATNTNWLGQSFTPTIQGGALGWIVTSIEMDLSGSGSAIYAVEVRSYIGGVVGDTVYGRALIDLSRLADYAGPSTFELIPLDNLALIDPGTSACVVFYRVSGSDSMSWSLRFATPPEGGFLLNSFNAGVSWSTTTFSHRSMAVHGQQIFAGPNGAPLDTVESVSIELTVTGETNPMRVSVRLPGGASAP